MQTIAFRAEYLTICAPCVSDDDTRGCMKGVSLSKWRAVATNGHAMIVAKLDVEPQAVAIEPAYQKPEPIILPITRDLLRHCKPYRTDYGERYVVVTRGEGLKVTVRVATSKDGAQLAIHHALGGFAKHTWETTLIDGTFPDYAKVVPRAETIPAVAPAFNLKLLALFEAASGSSGARIVPTAADKAAMVTFGRSDVFGVIMPMRNDDAPRPATPPDWI